MYTFARDLWVEALESDEFKNKQGHHALNKCDQEFCCLGVLTEVAHRNGVCSKQKSVWRDKDKYYSYGNGNNDGVLPKEVLKWAGLVNTADSLGIYIGDKEPKNYYSFITLNDTMNKSFPEIAELIRNIPTIEKED